MGYHIIHCQVHHEVTWRLLQPGTEFSVQLSLFNAGQSRSQLSMAFRHEIAIFRFAPVNETTIEEKHARVSLDSKKHHIGAVRVSLANRLRMLERLLDIGCIDIKDLLLNFGKLRNLVDVARHFGFDGNPGIEALIQLSANTNRNEMRKAVKNTVYRCDLDHLYHKMKAQAQVNAKATRRQEYAASKYLKVQSARDEDSMHRAAMLRHFRETSDPASVYSSHRSLVCVESLGDVLGEPATKRMRMTIADSGDGDLVPDICDDGEAVAADTDNVYFKIVLHAPGRKRQLHAAVGAGGRMSQNQISVTIHKSADELASVGEPAILGKPVTPPGNPHSPIMLLDGLAGPIGRIRDEHVCWTSNCIEWFAPGCATPDISDRDLSSVI